MKRIPRLLACLALAFAAQAAAAAPPSKSSIDEAVQRTLERFRSPGMSVSVVYDGKTWYSAGHGIREAGRSDRVDDETLFQIGSVSKAFTAATLALLADEGKLGWDDRVIDHLPEFRMYDPWVTREFTIRDLLTHRSGLPLGAGDLLIFPDGKTSRDEIVRALRHLKPASSFRSKFDYDNLLYIVAGEVVARVSGKSFDDFLEQRLLQPLGMSDCRATLERVPAGAATATPHMLVDGELATTTSRITATSAGAGGINCSARSMARWLAFMLNEGVTPEGERLLSETNFAQLVGPVTLLPAPGYLAEYAGAHLNAYALGWNVSTFYGEPILAHAGGVWGMTTFAMLFPRRGLAIFASNNLMSPAPRAIVNDIADRFLADDNPQACKDWIALIDEISASRKAEGAAVVAAAEAARDAGSRPSLPLERYAGAYRDPWYGDVRLVLEDDGQLWFRSLRNEPLQGPLEHFQFDTFIARWSDRRLHADAYVSFSLSPAGEVERIRMKAVSPTTDFSYDFHDLDLERVE
jgi:CubicO group peptidase (beta-lactamase class C family)